MIMDHGWLGHGINHDLFATIEHQSVEEAVAFLKQAGKIGPAS